jgi:hypothetical protein
VIVPLVLKHYWQFLFAPAGPAHSDRADRSAIEDTHARDAATRAERLEEIAIYARAGYFNLGYTVDAFRIPDGSPPY